MNELSSIDGAVFENMYGDKMLNDESKHRILTATIDYIKNTQRLKQALFKILEGNPFYQLSTNVLVYF